jgi:hypothetical protein
MSDRSAPRYPIYVPSKGRAATPLTARALDAMGVDFALVVEPPEADEYRQLKLGRVLELPFSDLGEGSIPARNWIWQHALDSGAARHWIVDDNIWRFSRLNYNRRIPVRTGATFRAVEAFSDRYTNVAFSGFHNRGFVNERAIAKPFMLNTRIYSMTLVNSALPYRWRGRYNEDTDICLRALKDGWCTVQFYAFLGAKALTMTMAGGNTDTVYATGDHRREFAESLKRQHPDCVEIVWRYGRWHHSVDYSRFRQQLQLRDDVTPTGQPDEFGMRLVRLVDEVDA